MTLVPSSALDGMEKYLNGKTELEFIVETMFPNVPQKHLTQVLLWCKRYGLDPMGKHVVVLEFSGHNGKTYTPYITRDGMIAHAQNTGLLDGLRTMDGYDRNSDDFWAEAQVHRKDASKPYVAKVWMKEYSTGRNQWKDRPKTMLAKVAIMHALRLAFPTSMADLPQEYFDRVMTASSAVTVIDNETPANDINEKQDGNFIDGDALADFINDNDIQDIEVKPAPVKEVDNRRLNHRPTPQPKATPEPQELPETVEFEVTSVALKLTKTGKPMVKVTNGEFFATGWTTRVFSEAGYDISKWQKPTEEKDMLTYALPVPAKITATRKGDFLNISEVVMSGSATEAQTGQQVNDIPELPASSQAVIPQSVIDTLHAMYHADFIEEISDKLFSEPIHDLLSKDKQITLKAFVGSYIAQRGEGILALTEGVKQEFIKVDKKYGFNFNAAVTTEELLGAYITLVQSKQASAVDLPSGEVFTANKLRCTNDKSKDWFLIGDDDGKSAEIAYAEIVNEFKAGNADTWRNQLLGETEELKDITEITLPELYQVRVENGVAKIVGVLK